MNNPSDQDGPPPLGQRLFDRPFLPLGAGLFVMFAFYTLWGLIEVLTLPAGQLPEATPMRFESGVVPPSGNWWQPAGRQERLWIAIAFCWCLVLFAMMPFWHLKGGQNPSGIRTKVEPAQFVARLFRFVEDYKIGEENGMPLVAPPPGADVYLIGQMWRWFPALQLEEGATYTLHLSALDVNHGFGLYPANINVQVIPGYDYGLRITPNQPGEYRILCNEFCGIGHHQMLGRILVTPANRNAALSPEASR